MIRCVHSRPVMRARSRTMIKVQLYEEEKRKNEGRNYFSLRRIVEGVPLKLDNDRLEKSRRHSGFAFLTSLCPFLCVSSNIVSQRYRNSDRRVIHSKRPNKWYVDNSLISLHQYRCIYLYHICYTNRHLPFLELYCGTCARNMIDDLF